MKITKVLLGLVLFAFLAFWGASRVSANEGIVKLSGQAESDGRCFAVSIYIDGAYKILMTCRGLSMALDPVLNKYVVWANVGERKQRLGEIVSGKLQSSVPDKFDSMFVTLEADGYPNKPSVNMVLTGKLEAIDFGKGLVQANLLTTVTATPATKVDDRGAVVPTVTPSATAATGRLTSVVVGIGKAILFGFILLLIVVGVMSFLARRKNL